MYLNFRASAAAAARRSIRLIVAPQAEKKKHVPAAAGREFELTISLPGTVRGSHRVSSIWLAGRARHWLLLSEIDEIDGQSRQFDGGKLLSTTFQLSTFFFEASNSFPVFFFDRTCLRPARSRELMFRFRSSL